MIFAMRSAVAPSPRQKGTALVVVMVFAMLLALSGLVAMSLAVQDERLAGNFQRQTEALAAAEAGLAATLPWLDDRHADCAVDLTVGEVTFAEGAGYTVNITGCLEDGRIVLRSTGLGADSAARRIVEAIYVPPSETMPGRYDSWREVVM